MNEKINTISEEQVLHNKLSFEINQELIHLMKRIIEIQQENKKYKEIIDKAIEYIKSYKIDYSPYELSDYNVRQILEILKGDSNE